MSVIVREGDADLGALDGRRVAVVGYGNQGRSWALNLRDSGLDVSVCVRADATRDAAEGDGFATLDLSDANEADVLCLLIPDDVVPTLPLAPRADALVLVASGYTLAFGRLDPACDVGMVAPRMPRPSVACARARSSSRRSRRRCSTSPSSRHCRRRSGASASRSCR